ncbi:histone-lysine N-methyltransferase SETMAR [Trichonephila clavipes]|nr:histone-lysine N-methyltransferase SETMAR [Trichonephila clavipes]
MEVNKENIRFFLQLFFDNGKNGSQAVEIANGVYGVDTVTANYVQVWFRRCRSVDRHVSSRSIAQKLKIDHKTVLSHLRKVGFKKKLYVWVPHQLTPKNMMDRVFICEALVKRNEMVPFLKWVVTGDEKWVTYYNIVRKQSWSKCVEVAQTMAKPGLMVRKILLCIWLWTRKK